MITTEVETKSLLKSKTFWTNAVLLVAMILNIFFGKEILTPEVQGQITEALLVVIPVINILLRKITGNPVTWV